MHGFSGFKEVIRELIALLEEFNKTETEKLDAVQRNLVTFVEEAMKKEQAYILKLRGLDRKRESIQKDLGWEGLTFQQILSQANDIETKELQPLFDQLSHIMAQFIDTKDSAQKALEVNLHHINSLIGKKAAEGNNSYNSSGNTRKPDKPVRHIRDTKI